MQIGQLRVRAPIVVTIVTGSRCLAASAGAAGKGQSSAGLLIFARHTSECVMRNVVFMVLAAALFGSGNAVAQQQWLNYVNPEFRFAVNFPVEPAVDEVVYTSSDGTMIGAHAFSASEGTSRYSVTVVQFPRELTDVEGEFDHAADMFRGRGEAWYDERGDYDGIQAHEVNLTAPNGRQILVSMLYYESRLFIVEAEVDANAAPPIQFQQSIAVVDETGQVLTFDN
jgi:hypothetical protein